MTSIADLYGLRSSSRRSPPHIVTQQASKLFQRAKEVRYGRMDVNTTPSYRQLKGRILCSRKPI